MLDPCHMLKLCRNALADMKVITSTDNKQISFKYLEELLSLQKKEGLKLSNKLTPNHIFYQNRKMNVKLAAQILSASVANALQFLLKSRHPRFLGCEETINFIRQIDSLFDIFNSRDPFGQNLKGPITETQWKCTVKILNECYDYLKILSINGTPILEHSRKMFVLGFLTNINSLKMLSDRLLKELNFKYILMYKFSQDHLELLFSCIRSRGGHNNNPNVQQFKCALRKLMYRNCVQTSKSGNCLLMDENRQNCILSFSNAVHEEVEEEVDSTSYNMVCEMLKNYEVSYYKENILYYVCGFIVKKIDAKITCTECSRMLLTSDSNLSSYTHFTIMTSKGKLIRASPDVLKLVKFLYSLFVSSDRGSSLNTHQHITVACRYFKGSIFKGHMSNVELSEDSHEVKLIKTIGSLFFKIFVHSFCKEQTTSFNRNKSGVRQKFNKLILFNNL